MKILPDHSSTLAVSLAALWLATMVGVPQADASDRKEGPITSIGTSKLLPCCKVTDVDPVKDIITVQDNKTGKVLKMRLGPGLPGKLSIAGPRRSKKYRRGQTVYMNSQGDRAAVTSFPINIEKKDNIGASSRTMKTEVILSDTGRMDGTTTIKTAEALRGFTGGVLVGVTDLDGNVLYTTKMRKYGVDGTANPNNNSKRTEKWTEQVPTKALDKAAALVIWQSHQPKNRFPGAAEWVVDNWDCLVEIYKKYKETQEGGGEPNQSEVWDPTTAEETKELVSKCKNLFGN